MTLEVNQPTFVRVVGWMLLVGWITRPEELLSSTLVSSSPW